MLITYRIALIFCALQLICNGLMQDDVKTGLSYIQVDNARISISCFIMAIIVYKAKSNLKLLKVKVFIMLFLILFGLIVLYPFAPVNWITGILKIQCIFRYGFYCIIFVLFSYVELNRKFLARP